MVTTIIELFLVSSAVAVAGVAVIWRLSRLVASFLEDLDGPPIDDSEWFDPPHEWVNYIPDADDDEDDERSNKDQE